MSQNEDYLESKAFEQYNGMDRRTEQLQKEVDELEEERIKALTPEEKPKTPEDEFKEAYSEVDIIAHDAKAAAANTRWAQQRFNEAQRAKQELADQLKKNQELQAKLEEATRREPSIPVEKWAEDNPESAAQVEARIHQNNLVQSEQLKAMQDKIDALEAEKTAEIAAQLEQAAVQALIKRVPDAQDLMGSPEFNAWLDQRPAMKQIMEGTLDVDSAENVLTTYKFQQSARTPEELKQQVLQADIEDGAEAVKSSSNQPLEQPEPKIWTGSEINAMSDQEFLDNEAEIMKAYAEGRHRPDL